MYFKKYASNFEEIHWNTRLQRFDIGTLIMKLLYELADSEKQLLLYKTSMTDYEIMSLLTWKLKYCPEQLFWTEKWPQIPIYFHVTIYSLLKKKSAFYTLIPHTDFRYCYHSRRSLAVCSLAKMMLKNQ